jgi:hypothetical protein
VQVELKISVVNRRPGLFRVRPTASAESSIEALSCDGLSPVTHVGRLNFEIVLAPAPHRPWPRPNLGSGREMHDGAYTRDVSKSCKDKVEHVGVPYFCTAS